MLSLIYNFWCPLIFCRTWRILLFCMRTPDNNALPPDGISFCKFCELWKKKQMEFIVKCIWTRLTELNSDAIILAVKFIENFTYRKKWLNRLKLKTNNLPAWSKCFSDGIKTLFGTRQGFVFVDFATTRFGGIPCTRFPRIWCYDCA